MEVTLKTLTTVFPEKFRRNLPGFLVWITLFVLAMPRFFQLPDSGIDSSWQIGLQQVASKHLDFGKDVIFSFGPLSYLFKPMLILPRFAWPSAFFSLVVHALSVQILFFILKYRLRSFIDRTILFLLALPLLLIINHAPDYLLIIMAMFALENPDDRIFWGAGGWFNILLGAIFLGYSLLLKTSAILPALFLVVLFSLVSIRRRKLFDVLVFQATLISTVASLWVYSGSDILTFPRYLFHSLEPALGYNSSMQSAGGSFLHLSSLLLLIISNAVFGASVRRTGHLHQAVFFAVLSFLVFKHSIVRPDFHLLYFFTTVPLFLLIFQGSQGKPRAGSHLRTLLPLFLAFAITIGLAVPIGRYVDFLAGPGNTFRLARACVQPGSLAEDLRRNKAALREARPLPAEMQDLIGDAPVGILPMDIFVAYAHDLNWSPQPTLQTFSAFTARLDELNAGHFSPPDNPEFILWSTQAFDQRYPVFDGPAVFLSLLENYRPVAINSDFLLLQKSSSAKMESIFLGETILQPGEPLVLPEVSNDLLLVQLIFDRKPLGKLLSILTKEPMVFIDLDVAAGFTDHYRINPEVLSSGGYVASLVRDNYEILKVFEGSPEDRNRIEALAIQWDPAFPFPPGFYLGDIRARIFRVAIQAP